MDYIGSKEKINDWMFSHIAPRMKKGTILVDACSGSGAVSKKAVSLGYDVVATDIMSFPQHILIGFSHMTNEMMCEARSHIAKMNCLHGKDGFFFNNYSESAKRLYFSDANARKIDACRQYINKVDDERIKSYLLYCMMEALSRVSNTAGVQAAFLKALKDRAQNSIEIREEPISSSAIKIRAFHMDLLDLIRSGELGGNHVLYIDPPYNERQYAPNYHLYETLCLYDSPQPQGKTGIRTWDTSKSKFCSKKTCLDFIGNIIELSTAKTIFMSYNSDGLVSRDEFENFIIGKFDREVTCHAMRQRRFKSDSDDSRTYNQTLLKEYLFEIPGKG